MPSEVAYTPLGRLEELDRLDLAGVLDYLRIYLKNFLLDADVAMALAGRLLREPGLDQQPRALRSLAYVLAKAVQAAPFDARIADLAARLTGDPVLARRAALLAALPTDRAAWSVARCLGKPRLLQSRRDWLAAELRRHPGHAAYAAQLLALDFFAGEPPGDWLGLFRPPAELLPAWNRLLFCHLAEIGRDAAALDLWPRVEAAGQSGRDETALNLAAELYRRAGDAVTAQSLYACSLALDPLQEPVRRRLAGLAAPFAPDASLTQSLDVTVCLYSWNKARLLQQTLETLANTNLGRARVRVLINGSTDDSLAMARAAAGLFPGRDYQVVALPVNVGAPGARNWLLSLPEVRQAEFVAFLDDDAEAPAHWLAGLLAALESDPGAAVAGSKVVSPGAPAMLQYLYRTLAVARKNLIRLTDPTPIARYDTGLYDVVRPADNVMGCCHLLRTAHLEGVPGFDIRYSPSQVDDVAHDLELRLAGRRVLFCGPVTCVHHQSTGISFGVRPSGPALGNVLGNDVKFHAWFAPRLADLQKLMGESR
ncbi:MAG: glycosyltransferase [Thermodesulfobacteriota bacterium]